MDTSEAWGPNTTVTCERCKVEQAEYRVLRSHDPAIAVGSCICVPCSLDVEGLHLDRMDSVLPLCDFCSTPHPDADLWVLRAKPYYRIDLAGTLHFFSADWAVCPACKPLIETRDVEGLVERVASIMVAHMEIPNEQRPRARALLTVELRNNYETLWKLMRLPLDPTRQ